LSWDKLLALLQMLVAIGQGGENPSADLLFLVIPAQAGNQGVRIWVRAGTALRLPQRPRDSAARM
jgi:hypothetical protein